MSYAAQTTVSPEKSRAEIEGLLRKYGADQFVSGWGDGQAVIGFRASGRFVKFTLPMPDKGEEKFWYTKTGRWRSPSRRSDSAAALAWEQEIRRRWRALALVIKAKLEAVESGITTFESEFMAHIVMPDGRTVGDHVTPSIAAAYETGKVAGLLPEFTS